MQQAVCVATELKNILNNKVFSKSRKQLSDTNNKEFFWGGGGEGGGRRGGGGRRREEDAGYYYLLFLPSCSERLHLVIVHPTCYIQLCTERIYAR